MMNYIGFVTFMILIEFFVFVVFFIDGFLYTYFSMEEYLETSSRFKSSGKSLRM